MTTQTLANVNITILVQNLPVPFDRRVWQEALALREAGAKVTVICPSDSKHRPGKFLLEGIRVWRYSAPREAEGPFGYIKEYSWALFMMFCALARISRRSRQHVIQFCNPPDLLFLVALPFKMTHGSKLIFDQHDLGPELMRAKGWRFGNLLSRVSGVFEWATYRSANRVVATNESYRQISVARGRIHPSKVAVVRSGPPANWGEVSVTDDRWRFGHKFLIGYVGVMGRQEGLEYLLEATGKLLSIGYDIQLCLVGSGPDRDRLERLSKELGLDENVSFLGRLPDADLQSVLKTADVCVNADEFNELNDKSTMNKIIEYMALARPIVQFDVAEGRYSAGESSLYAINNDSFSMASNIAKLLDDPELAGRMGLLGRERFENHLSWERQKPILIELYADLLRSSSPPPDTDSDR